MVCGAPMDAPVDERMICAVPDVDSLGDIVRRVNTFCPAVPVKVTATWNQYVRNDLKFESDLPYEILTGRVRPWSYDQFQNRYVNVAETLANAMTQNKDLKVFVANGNFDLATPFLATEYTFSHMRLDPDVRGNVTMDFFDAGHMMYTHLPSLERVKADMAKFIAGATPKTS